MTTYDSDSYFPMYNIYIYIYSLIFSLVLAPPLTPRHQRGLLLLLGLQSGADSGPVPSQ